MHGSLNDMLLNCKVLVESKSLFSKKISSSRILLNFKVVVENKILFPLKNFQLDTFEIKVVVENNSLFS